MGLRPLALGGYEENEISAGIRARLRAIIEAKAQMHHDLLVVTGLDLGTEMLAAEAAALAGVRYVAVLAFPDQERAWPESTRVRFRHLLDGASGVRTLQNRPPENTRAVAPSFARRNAWLRKNASEAIVVWDGADEAVGRSYRSLVDGLGEELVWLLDPGELAH
jgi:uncharacterized phage-like protein YoqJ